MRALPLLMAFSAVTVLAVPLSAAAQCIPCEPVNNVCRKVLHVDCLASVSSPAPAPATASAAPCAGGACDTLNDLCGDCLPAAAQESRCMLEACAAVDSACQRVLHTRCLA